MSVEKDGQLQLFERGNILMAYPWIKLKASELPLEKLGGARLQVYLAIAALVDRDRQVTISQKYLAGLLKVTERTIVRSINELVNLNIISVWGKPGRVSTYRILKGARVGTAEEQRASDLIALPDQDAQKRARGW